MSARLGFTVLKEAGAVGVGAEAAQQAQAGKAENTVDQALLDLAVLEERGHVTDDVLQAAHGAGLDNATLVEVVGLVSVNSLSNWMNDLHHQ